MQTTPNQEDLRGKWTDKIVMITGTSAGIGVETARTIATTGARIYLPVRSPSKIQEALRDLIETGQVTLLELDLNSLDSVRKAAATFLSMEKAATAKDLEGRGGLYLENLAPSEPAKLDAIAEKPGYAPWAFDEENEKKLWDLSLQLVGLA
ncbi:uncharacterized protein NECHADRAFT_81636 [Fusarium vanettenii 77-13-4]|uniref:Ketoreductase (KR) domain-containing protein n=1 Tax=Fusarium vanettenii (strain ATCC MYA-4622 / CBS 123669 / FGSC 9596 / NRRL 45880 / 77-13-4) TaxID=660122 RepID=C7Z8U8_FUSV7|nr:uncharacterized protein NECHADRAFT_81636 [Fusarium vanettenii 77-13-4]EEU39449.1 hypothetical protein NECHADRAFT_81636 [Fusarium vanettenii 77-13-4]